MQRLDDWRALGEAGQIDQLFARILDDSGVISRELFAQGVKGRASERAITNYLHLFELLQREVGARAVHAARAGAAAGRLRRGHAPAARAQTPTCSGWRPTPTPCRS